MALQALAVGGRGSLRLALVVLGLGDGQGVLVAYVLEFGTELGDVLDVIPNDVAAGPGQGSGEDVPIAGGQRVTYKPLSDGYASAPVMAALVLN